MGRQADGRVSDDGTGSLAPLCSALRPVRVLSADPSAAVEIVVEKLDAGNLALSIALVPLHGTGPCPQHVFDLGAPDPAAGGGGGAEACARRAGLILVEAVVRLGWLSASPDWEMVEVLRHRVRSLVG